MAPASEEDEPWMAFSFLKFPVEIHDEIYDLSLDFNTALKFVNPRFQHPPNCPERWASCDQRSTPGILLLSHQIYDEAIRVLYSKPFIMQRSCSPHLLITCFSKLFLQQIRHVTFQMDLDQDSRVPDSKGVCHGGRSDALSLLGFVWQQRHNLKSLNFHISGPFNPQGTIPIPFCYTNHLIEKPTFLRGVKPVNMETEHLFPLLNESERNEIREMICRRILVMKCPQSEIEVIPYQSNLMSAISVGSGIRDRFSLFSFGECRRWWSLNQWIEKYKRTESSKESEDIGMQQS